MAPLCLLMVEDSDADAELLLRELRNAGYEVTFARVDSPAAMSAALASQQWDVVICDYFMPHWSGIDALRLLRSQDADLPCIFLSGAMGEEAAVAAMKEGAQDYVMKDKTKRLLPAIEREVREHEQRRQRRQLEQELYRLRKFEEFGKLAGGIAHDFNNALAVILGWAQFGCQEALNGSRQALQEKFEAIREQAQRGPDLAVAGLRSSPSARAA